MNPSTLAGNAALIARMNRSSILRLVKEQGPISRTQVAAQLKLNPATVGRVVSQLLKKDLLIEIGEEPLKENSRGGRRALLLEYNHKAGYVIGLHLDAYNLLGVLADLGGDLVRIVELPPSPTRNRDENLDRVCSIVSELLQAEAHIGDSVRGLGIAVSSVVVNPEGIVTNSADLGWRDMPLKSLLQQRFGFPVFVQNECNLGALAETLWGAGRGASDLVWLSMGPGIGSGIIVDGRIRQGAHHAAGELAFMLPGLQYLGETYARFGCMEPLCSCSAMVVKARCAVEVGDLGLLKARLEQSGVLEVADVFDAARADDPLALSLVRELVDYTSLIIVNIATVLDPDLIVLSRDLASAGDLLIPRIEARVRGVCPAQPRILTSELKEEAIIRGAVALALQAAEDQFYVSTADLGEVLVM